MSAQDAKTQQLNERLQFVDLDNGQRDALKRAVVDHFRVARWRSRYFLRQGAQDAGDRALLRQ